MIKCRNPDNVFLNETHVTESCDISDFKLKSYQVLIICSSHSTHTVGASVCVNKNIRFSNVTVIKEQCAWYMSIEIIVNNEPTILTGLYLSDDSINKSIVMQSCQTSN